MTSTLRDIPTAVRLGPDDGLDRECIASLDNLTLLPKARFVQRIAMLGPERMEQLGQPSPPPSPAADLAPH